MFKILLSRVLPLGMGLCLGAQSAATSAAGGSSQSGHTRSPQSPNQPAARETAHVLDAVDQAVGSAVQEGSAQAEEPVMPSSSGGMTPARKAKVHALNRAAKHAQQTPKKAAKQAPRTPKEAAKYAQHTPKVASEAPSTPAPTQAPDPALVTLASVQAFYDQTRDVTADFQQTYVNKLYDRTDRSRGHVVFQKPGRMRWDYAKPNGKVIVASSGKLTVYEPGDEPTDKGQVLQQNFAQAELPQAMSFLLGTGKLTEDFDAKLLDSAREGFPKGQVLELRPKQPSPHFDRLLFYVETQAALRGLVRRIVIIDASGNRNRFDFSALKFNSNVADSTFEWKPPADARRVQL